ncbi:MAG TPA: hypothetical protein VJS37_03345 [Terriglobales bacterium]|nr:hypothetical protein [Terriglobales bacterium]
MRIRVIGIDGIDSYWTSRKDAKDLVAKGKALQLSDHAIRMVGKKFIEHKSPRISLQSQQGKVYEAAAIQTHPQFVVGGLNRTEHQPYPKPGILTWGHIGETKQTPKPR